MGFKVSRQNFQQKFQSTKRYINLIEMLPGILFSIALLVMICLWSSAAMCAHKKYKKRFPVISIPENAKGERAIQVLADKLPEVAAWYGKTSKQFSTMLRKDHTARIGKKGRLFYIEEKPEHSSVDETPPLAEGPFPYDQTFKLHSRPGSKRVIFLDFDGDTITDSAWNKSYGEPIVAKPYDLDGDTSSFSSSEMDRVQNVWLLVSEDFAPFDVDVTTEDPGQDAITRSSNSDDRYGTKVVMTVDNFASCGCGGFAYVGVFDYFGNYYKPAFVFNKSLVGAAEAASHEAGHNLGLSHDGIVNGATYYSGHGNGATGWAPIMGVGYYKELVQWSKGGYSDANNTQDDIQIIQDTGLEIMADDHGNNTVTSTALDSTTDGTTITLSGKGLIERRTDVDAFSFVSGNGDLSINIDPSQLSPNLDIEAGLYDSSGTLIKSSNPTDSLNASFSESALPAGEYFVMIKGIGKGDPLLTGYTDYASLGNYTISGSVSDPGGMKPPVAVATVDPSASGYAPLTLNFYGNESYDTDGSIVSYEWNFDDGSDFSTNVTPTHTYYAPGNYMATLTVTDNDGLTNTATVAITVENQAPIAVILVDPTSGTAPLAVNYDGSGSYDPDAPNGIITDYYWDFGDGGSSINVNPSHTYNMGGSYTVILTVTDDHGDTGSMEVIISITGEINQAPNVDAGPDQIITLPAYAVLDCTVTDDGLPNPPGAVTTTWTKVSGPGTVTFADIYVEDTTATFSDPGTYVLQLLANDGELSTSNMVTITVNLVAATISLNSIGTEDGWVRESLENSNVGGKSVSTGSGRQPIRLGDHKKDRQYKSILSFDTSLIPGNATVLSATLRLMRGNVKGTNPFQTHGTCWVDVTTGGFSGNTVLQNSDFEAIATVTQSTSLSNAASNGSWSIADLDQAGLDALNTEGKTQFRIYFQRDDNDDRSNDFIGYYSGDNGNAAKHPQLVITYK